MTRPALWLHLAAHPTAKGATALLARAHAAAREGRQVRAILSGPGLEWTREEALAALARLDGAEISLCSQSARRGGWDAEALPRWVRWSSVAAWLTRLGPADELWGAFE